MQGNRFRESKALVLTMAAVLGLLLHVPAFAAEVLRVVDEKVGIGTSTPISTLEVVGNGTAQITVTDTAGTNGSRSLFQLSNFGRTTFTLQNRAALPVNSLWYFLVSNAGRFAIGRAGSGVDEFQVTPVGDVIITGTLTTAGGFYPDYVFDPGYELMPLVELETFIETNGHLPRIPKAEETGHGQQVNMSELQLLLLEKIEELTLYTIDQEKRLAQQAEQLRALEAQIRTGATMAAAEGGCTGDAAPAVARVEAVPAAVAGTSR